MNKNNLFLLIVFCLLCLTACGSAINLDAPVGQNPFIEASPIVDQPIMDVVMPSATPEATLTPTQAGTATTNYAERVGQAQLALANSLATATMQFVISDMTEKATIKTSTALQGFVNGTASATVAIGDKKATGTAAVTLTLVAKAVETDNAAATATQQWPATQKAQTEADWAPFWQAVLLIGTILIFVVVIWGGLLVGHQLARLIYEKRLALRQEQAGYNEQREEPPPAAQPAPGIDVRLDYRDKYGFGSVNFTTLPIDKETLVDVAGLITSGARYTEAQMTGAGNPLVKDKTFDSFGTWMCDNYIAVKLDKRYSIQHPEFFERVLQQ